jgi:hypothetical protein
MQDEVHAVQLTFNAMMRVLLVAAILYRNIHPACAEPELGLLLKAGLNAAVQRHDARFNLYGATGGLGGYLETSFDNGFSFAGQIDLLYTPRGSRAVFQGEYLGTVRLHYVDVSIAARPAVRLGSASLYALLGGSLCVLLSARKENAAGAAEDITGDTHRIDVALLGGVGVALHVPRDLGPLQLGTVFLEARHDVGLIDADVFGGFKNRSSSVMLGLSFVVAGRRSPDPPPSPVTAGATGP